MDHVEASAGVPGSVTAGAIRELVDDVRPDLLDGAEGKPLSDGEGGAGRRPSQEPRAHQGDRQETHATRSSATHFRPPPFPGSFLPTHARRPLDTVGRPR